MNVGLHHRSVDPQLRTVLQSELDRCPNHQVVDCFQRLWRQTDEATLKGVMLRHRRAVEVGAAGNLRATLVEYTQQFPHVEIEMLERSRGRLTTALRNGVIDAAIVTGERALLGSRSTPLWSERILVVLPSNHRLVGNQTVSWTDLGTEVLLLGRRDPGPVIQEYLNAKLVSPEDRPWIVWHDVSRESIKSLVGASLGIGLTLEASLGTNSEDVVHREIRDGGGPARIGLSVNWLEDNQNPALANLLNLLKRRYPSSF
jgi:DNA-binding transcriptional LysR family regulator